jgi:hypothetical protein
MIEGLKKLSSSQLELVMKAPFLVCILIAGADGNIDKKEIKGALRLAEKNQSREKSKLMEFYENSMEDFEDKLKVILRSFPSDAVQRGSLIVAELQGLNQVFSKLDTGLSIELYKSLKELALKVAQSSGGVLGFGAIAEEEARLITLPMLDNPESK